MEFRLTRSKTKLRAILEAKSDCVVVIAKIEKMSSNELQVAKPLEKPIGFLFEKESSSEIHLNNVSTKKEVETTLDTSLDCILDDSSLGFEIGWSHKVG